MTWKHAAGAAVIVVLVLLLAPSAGAHCDTMNGPVVAAARAALQANDVTPVLKWVKPSEEAEVRETFRKTMAVRGLSPAAQDLADRFLFETVVRLHRLGEGEPYTGLKADPVDDAIAGADRALRDGNVEAVVKSATERVAAGVRERFARARELQRHADESVAAGRRYVEAYVDFMHFVEEANARGPAEGAAHKASEK